MEKNSKKAGRRSNRFGELVIQKRSERGISIHALGRDAGFHFGYISRVETGDERVGPGPAFVEAVCNALNIDLAYGQFLAMLDHAPEPGGTFLEKMWLEHQAYKELIGELPATELQHLEKLKIVDSGNINARVMEKCVENEMLLDKSKKHSTDLEAQLKDCRLLQDAIGEKRWGKIVELTRNPAVASALNTVIDGLIAASK